MLCLARLIGAEEALRLGLVTTVADDPMAEAEAIARTVAGHAPRTLRATTERLRRVAAAARRVEDRDLIELRDMSDDVREGLAAFLSKRLQRFTGD